MAGMIEYLIELVLGAALIAISIWLGMDGEAVKLVVVLVIGWILLWIAANSAYQDAHRRRDKTERKSSES
jgi:ABC-type transport system involved in Fe-S cluster assembly fused permease/ATPase subunit